MNEIILEINKATNKLIEALPDCEVFIYGDNINDAVLSLMKRENYVDPHVKDLSTSSMRDFVNTYFSNNYDQRDADDRKEHTEIYTRALEIDRLIGLYHITN